MNMKAKAVVVTGTSTGIGASTAKYLVDEGFYVFGGVRNGTDGARLQDQLGDAFSPLIMDVTDEEEILAAAAEVERVLDGATLAGLVNNAGIAIGGPISHLQLDAFRRQFEVNFFGLISVTQTFLPLLGCDEEREGPPGRVVNVGSLAGKIAFPFLAPYSASKHALEALTVSLRRELLLFGIDVIMVAPGSVATPIWDKAKEADFAPYEETKYVPALSRLMAYLMDTGPNGDPPERVARIIHAALTVPKPKVRYAPVHGKFMNWTLPRLLPARVVDRKIGRELGLLK